jgi:hypothetical protein
MWPSVNQWQTTYRPDTSSPGDALQMSIRKKILSPRPYGYWLLLSSCKDGEQDFCKKKLKKIKNSTEKNLKKLEKKLKKI